MQPENIHLDNPLTSREEVLRLVNEMLNAVAPYFKNDASRIDLANFTAHYGQQVASMETFSRLLWGVTPLLAGGSEPQHFSFYLQAIKNGTNPQHADYWGEVAPYDQRIVEMAASVSGLLFNFTPLANFLLSSGTSVLMLLVLISLKIGDEQLRNNNVISANKIVFADVLMLLKNRKFWMFSLYVAGVAWMMFIAEQQFPRYFVSFFATKEQGNAWYGYLSTVQSGMEFVMMMFIPWLVNHYGAKRGLLFCGCVVGARLIASGLTNDPIVISIIKPFYGVEIALLLISVFKYIAEHFHRRVNATMYLLGYQAMIYVGSIVVAPPAGYLYDKIGFEHTYLLMGCCALTFTLISAFTLSRCQSKRDASRPFTPALDTASVEPAKH